MAQPSCSYILTYEIVHRLELANVRYKDELFKIAILYFADDGLMLTPSTKEAERNITFIQQVAEEFGLLKNKAKSNILIYNMTEQLEKIENIEVCNKLNI